ncbi:MAG: glycosyltransferase [Ruminococcus flavefaciens]|nr:glycosyltransferase [Ruminococcus flavefaciens]
MKKTGFIIPWYSDDISGGAENMLRDLTADLHKKNFPVEILTTCAGEFHSDWNRNHYKEGVYFSRNNIPVRRFKIRKRDTSAFDEINFKLMNNIHITYDEEKVFLREMINSNSLYRYMLENSDNYSLFVFIPYMFGTTYWGMKLFPEKSVLIPCLHNEPYAHMEHFKRLFPKTAGMIFNSEPEKIFAENIYNLKNVRTLTAGIGMDTDISGNPEDFRIKYNIHEPFILYSGRKDSGKNIDTLIRYYGEYIRRKKSNLRLVMTGGGKTVRVNNIIDLGYVSQQDKYNAMSACEFLCQPSVNESFSLVIMESWLCSRPVLVHEKCDVTRNFVSQSDGGLYFGNYPEFEACTDFILENNEIADKMGVNGSEYVKKNFSRDTVTEKYIKFFGEIIKENKEKSFT